MKMDEMEEWLKDVEYGITKSPALISLKDIQKLIFIARIYREAEARVKSDWRDGDIFLRLGKNQIFFPAVILRSEVRLKQLSDFISSHRRKLKVRELRKCSKKSRRKK